MILVLYRVEKRLTIALKATNVTSQRQSSHENIAVVMTSSAPRGVGIVQVKTTRDIYDILAGVNCATRSQVFSPPGAIQ